MVGSRTHLQPIRQLLIWEAYIPKSVLMSLFPKLYHLGCLDHAKLHFEQ